MLTLPIKKKWFDMIKSGEKKEEYRNVSDFYRSRFNKHLYKKTLITFRNGYSANSPKIECLVLVSVGYGQAEWGADTTTIYFVLRILEVKEQSQ